MKKSLAVFILGWLFFPDFLLTQDIDLGRISISKSYTAYFLNKYKFSQEEFEDRLLFSPEEFLEYSSQVDLRRRSLSGIQQDISIRGSGFEDVRVCIEGLEINDLQAVHFTLELPLTIEDLESLEIFPGQQRINYFLKGSQNKGGILRFGFGEHALREKSFLSEFPRPKV